MAKKTSKIQTTNYLGKIEKELESNKSRLNMILGSLIVLVIGILVFNYFNSGKADLGPAQSTTSTDQQQDVASTDLPGKYTVKEDDTLFEIANKYYNDGYKFTAIAQANNLSNADQIEVGQVLDIPKLDNATPTPVVVTEIQDQNQNITENTYTVQQGDWLSTISERAYGDIYLYQKIADANHITDPNLIEVGQVLTIPR